VVVLDVGGGRFAGYVVEVDQLSVQDEGEWVGVFEVYVFCFGVLGDEVLDVGRARCEELLVDSEGALMVVFADGDSEDSRS
jgi:hypothetical protein